MKRLIVFLILVGAVSISFGQEKDQDVIFKALNDEMARSMNELKFKSFEKPYFIEYVVNDSDMLAIRSTYGGLTSSSQDKNRILVAKVRLGSYEFDSSATARIGLPLETDYDVIRHMTWLITDSVYKRVINSYESKKASRKETEETLEEDEKGIPSFSKATPVVGVEEPIKVVVDKELWEARARKWSAMFKSMPQFEQSNVNLYVTSQNRYLLNSEGSKLLQPRLLLTYDVHARAESSEDKTVAPFRHIFSKTFDAAPSDKEIEEQIRNFAKELATYNDAGEIEDTYIGPALFVGAASANLVNRVLAPALRAGDGGAGIDTITDRLAGGIASGTSSEDRIGRKVLPTSISVYDDPTRMKYGESDLVGSYKYDDQGVEAKPIVLVENGILKTLLSTRTPTKKMRESNGRSRAGGTNISNLIVESKKGMSIAELKELLIEECKAQGLPFGVIFRTNQTTLGEPDGVNDFAYKVYVDDGREEPFRNGAMGGVSFRDLRDILATGDDPFVFNMLLNSSYNGTGTPASIVTPSLLIEEVTVGKSKLRKNPKKMVTAPTPTVTQKQPR